MGERGESPKRKRRLTLGRPETRTPQWVTYQRGKDYPDRPPPPKMGTPSTRADEAKNAVIALSLITPLLALLGWLFWRNVKGKVELATDPRGVEEVKDRLLQEVEWDKVKTTEPKPFTFQDDDVVLGAIKRVREGLKKHNEALLFQGGIRPQEILSQSELIEVLGKFAQTDFRTVQEFQWDRLSPEEVEYFGEGHDEKTQGLRLWHQRNTIFNIDTLARTAGCTIPEILGEPADSTAFHETVMRQAQEVWRQIQEMNRTGEAENRRRLYGEPSKEKRGDVWALYRYGPDYDQGFKLPALIFHIQDMLKIADINSLELILNARLNAREVRKLMELEIRALWQPIIKHVKYPTLADDPSVESVVQIIALADFISLEPTDLIGAAQWKEELSRLADREINEAIQLSRAGEITSRTRARVAFLLRQSKLLPEASKQDAPIKSWQDLQKVIDDVLKAIPINPDKERLQQFREQIDELIKAEAQSSPQSKDSKENSPPAAATHKGFFRRLASQMRKEVTSPQAALVAAEASVVATKTALGVTSGWFLTFADFTGALASILVTVKLAKITGNGLRRLAGKSPV